MANGGQKLETNFVGVSMKDNMAGIERERTVFALPVFSKADFRQLNSLTVCFAGFAKSNILEY